MSKHSDSYIAQCAQHAAFAISTTASHVSILTASRVVIEVPIAATMLRGTTYGASSALAFKGFGFASLASGVIEIASMFEYAISII